MFSNTCIIIHNSPVIDVTPKVTSGAGSVMAGVRLSVRRATGGGSTNTLILTQVNMSVTPVIVVMVTESVGEENFIKKDYFLIHIFFFIKNAMTFQIVFDLN